MAQALMEVLKSLQDVKSFQDLTWQGNFSEYLEIVRQNPKVARAAFQRVYDMIMSHGSEEYKEYKKKIVRYGFFKDPFENGKDAVFGLDLHLMKLVHLFKSAAHRYGTEKRIFLLHGPVGSSKSTIARLLKKGLEAYSRSPEGALYTFRWIRNGVDEVKHIFGNADEIPCPMHEEPLRLVPEVMRQKLMEEVNKTLEDNQKILVEGDLCPPCRYMFRELLHYYQGDWAKLVENHIRVRRMVLSEKDRVGIGTFQPKDEKNQDSTELTGDINYRKIAEYGSESDPRAFNFDGEFNIANRGII
ncbi:MAG: serine protein kinase, partial [Deltaproteobacteria bacterium]|nr:serine protein kinase [Deltaproteobacteria bacterium]